MSLGDPYFQVDVDEAAEPVRLHARGELDAASADTLDQHLAAVGAAAVALDLSGVSFIDSSGLRVITAAIRRAGEQGGSLVIDAVSEPVRRIFDMTGLSQLLTP